MEEIREELQRYVADQDLNALFVGLMEQLLIAKPVDPVVFAVAYLANTFPSRFPAGLAALVAEAGGSAASGADAAEPKASQPRASGGNASAQKKDSEAVKRSRQRQDKEVKSGGADDDDVCSEYEESDDDDDDYVDELPAMPSHGQAGQRRRTAVSAESGNPDAGPATEVMRVPKNASELRLILDLLRQDHFMGYLPEDQLVRIAEAMLPKTFQARATIIKKGDEGDFFYLLKEGTVHVFVDAKGEAVHSYGPGDCFGELALLYNAPRAASCVAAADVCVYALRRSDFRTLVMRFNMEKLERNSAFVDRVPILEQLTSEERYLVADCLVPREWAPGEAICREGDPGNDFFIVESGVAVVSKADLGEIGRLTTGEYFGEIALLTRQPRQATIVAAPNGPPLRTLSLDRPTFKRVMGPLDAFLRRNMATYFKVITEAS